MPHWSAAGDGNEVFTRGEGDLATPAGHGRGADAEAVGLQSRLVAGDSVLQKGAPRCENQQRRPVRMEGEREGGGVVEVNWR